MVKTVLTVQRGTGSVSSPGTKMPHGTDIRQKKKDKNKNSKALKESNSFLGIKYKVPGTVLLGHMNL